MTKTQTTFDSFKSESEFTKRTSQCIGSLQDNILIGEVFSLSKVEIFESEYQGNMNENAILTVSKGGEPVSVYTGAKALLSKLKASNADGLSMADFINQGNAMKLKLIKTKGKGQYSYLEFASGD